MELGRNWLLNRERLMSNLTSIRLGLEAFEKLTTYQPSPDNLNKKNQELAKTRWDLTESQTLTTQPPPLTKIIKENNKAGTSRVRNTDHTGTSINHRIITR